MADSSETAGSMSQTYRPKAERNPVQVIDRDIANAFNKLLDKSKKKFPGNPFVKKMNPANPSRTQLACLVAKANLIRNCLKDEEPSALSSLAGSKKKSC
jgi:hypothetical protein